MAITQLRPQHATGRRYGSFAGRTPGGEPPVESVILVGGDDAPRKRKRKRREQHELFQELEATVHALLHPDSAVEAPEEVQASLDSGTARQIVDELVVLAQGQHQLMQRAAAIREELTRLETARREQDEEDEFLMFL